MIDFAKLPVGTIVDFVSADRRRFSVCIAGDVDLSRGAGRPVRVLEAPCRYSNEVLMFPVPEGTRLSSLDAMYRMAYSLHRDGLSTLGSWDTIIIVDDKGGRSEPSFYHFQIEFVAVR